MMRAIWILLLMAGLAACTSSQNSDGEDDAADTIETTGTIRFIDVEGGFYGIVADDGTRYDPTPLPEEFWEDGLRVRFRAEIREGMDTTRMWGQLVRVIEIERL